MLELYRVFQGFGLDLATIVEIFCHFWTLFRQIVFFELNTKPSFKLSMSKFSLYYFVVFAFYTFKMFIFKYLGFNFTDGTCTYHVRKWVAHLESRCLVIDDVITESAGHSQSSRIWRVLRGRLEVRERHFQTRRAREMWNDFCQKLSTKNWESKSI